MAEIFDFRTKKYKTIETPFEKIIREKKKKKKPLFQGPVRPETDEELFRRTGTSRKSMEETEEKKVSRDPAFIRGERQGEGFVRIDGAWINVSQIPKRERKGLEERGVQFPTDIEKIRDVERGRIETEEIQAGVRREVGQVGEREARRGEFAEEEAITNLEGFSEADRITAQVKAKYPNMPTRNELETDQEWFRRYNAWRMEELGGYYDPRGEFRSVFGKENLGITGKTFGGGMFGAGSQMLLSVFPLAAQYFGWTQTTTTGKILKIGPFKLKTLLRGGAWAAGGLSGADTLTVWLASDNIITGAAFSANMVLEAFENNEITREEALRQMDEVQTWVDDSEGFVKTSVKANPVLWVFGKQFLINARKGQSDLAKKRDRIEFGV